MKKHLLLLSLSALVLVGQGCLPFQNSSTASNDGGLWQTTNDGRDWAQLSTFPQASGVGSIGGVSVNDIEIDPRDASVYYLATAQNGLFYTYDNGSTWQRPKAENVRSGAILEVEVDPRNVCMVYALTPKTVLKSVDCARSFEQVFVEAREDQILTTFVIDWFNPDIFWMGTSGGEVLRSQDGARNWTMMHDAKNPIIDLALGNSDSRLVLVGTRTKGLLRRNPETGEFVSYERILSDYSQSRNVRGFAQTANGSTILMNTDYGIFSSADKGENWTPLNLITPPKDLDIWSIAIDPKDDNVIYYVSDSTFHVTRSGGEAWSSSRLPSTRTVTALQVHPENTSVVIAGFTPLED